MKDAPNAWQLDDLVKHAVSGGVQCGLPDGRWVPARPLGFYGLRSRLRCAWDVFTGRADAVYWPGQ